MFPLEFPPMLERTFFNKLTGRVALLERVADPVVGGNGLVGSVPEAKGLLGNSDAKAPREGADGFWGRVAEVVEGNPLHNDSGRVA